MTLIRKGVTWCNDAARGKCGARQTLDELLDTVVLVLCALVYEELVWVRYEEEEEDWDKSGRKRKT